MNKWKDFEWTEECARAFQQLKEYLSHPPFMSSPGIDEVLFAYIAVAPYAMSLVLIRVDSGKQTTSLLREQVITRSRDSLSTIREGNPSGGAWYLKASPLLPSTHGGYPNLTSIKSHTSKC